jgi:hypothetical protein
MVGYKRHPYFSDYSITTDGKVISHKWSKNRELKQQPDRKGYLQVKLSKDKREYTRKVHRLVAETYIKNPECLEQVNHINEIKNDNRVDNLEWCNNQYNMEYSRSKKYLLEHLETKTITPIFNLRKTCAEMGLTCSCLHRTLGGKRNHHKGYKLHSAKSYFRTECSECSGLYFVRVTICKAS